MTRAERHPTHHVGGDLWGRRAPAHDHLASPVLAEAGARARSADECMAPTEALRAELRVCGRRIASGGRTVAGMRTLRISVDVLNITQGEAE